MRYRDWRKRQMRRPGFVLWSLWLAVTNRCRNKKLLRMLEQWENEPDVEFGVADAEPFELRPSNAVPLTPAIDADLERLAQYWAAQAVFLREKAADYDQLATELFVEATRRLLEMTREERGAGGDHMWLEEV